MAKKEKCTKCWLGGISRFCNESPGWGNPDAKLVIVLDAPGNGLAEKLLIWILRRLNLTSDDVWIDYMFKCPLPPKPKKADLEKSYHICWNHIIRKELLAAKSVVVAGNWGCKFLVGREMKVMHGMKDEDTEIWVTYSFKYMLMNPAECLSTWRVIYKAAKEAGLKPEMVIDVEPFQFPSKKLA